MPNDNSGHAEILIVEDNVFEMIAIKGMLEGYQYKCDSAMSAFEAFKMIQDRINAGQVMYKLILIDYKMPNCNGAEATAMIKSLLIDYDNKWPYIACLSNFNEISIKKSVIRAGVDVFLSKPIFKVGIYRLL